MTRSLHVVMYHYVRDLPNTPFPRIKGMHTRAFCQQVAALQYRYEMATLESALDFIHGTYRPARDLCLLTFDDGLKEHYSEITPLLMDRKIQGVFFVITSCLAGKYVAPVHMNHFLMAVLDFEQYRNTFLSRLIELSPDSNLSVIVNPNVAQHTYRWDPPEIASFKYLFNFVLDWKLRDRILHDLFCEKIGDEESFASTLYLNSEAAREMQTGGMIIGGHSHQHKPLSSLSDQELEFDLTKCQRLLTEKLNHQPLWPFCYPYGRKASFNDSVLNRLKQLDFACAFSTDIGSNAPGADPFSIRRLDCKDVRS